MKKSIQVLMLGFFVLFYFTISTEAADITPWNLHKQSAEQTRESFRTLLQEQSLQQQEELKRMITEEKRAMITEIYAYQEELETSVKETDGRFLIHEIFSRYEKGKKESIALELEEEIGIFLTEHLKTK